MTNLFLRLLSLSALCLHCAHSPAADSDLIQVTGQATIYQHTGTNPKDPANVSGLNHGPTVALLPDGRLLAAWFSAPFEGAPSQRIMQAFSSDQGLTWSEAKPLQDFAAPRSDFDPALFVAGKETFLFFTATEPTRVHFERSADSAQTWSEPIDIGQPNHTTRSNGIQLSTGELLAPLHLRGTKGAGVMKSSDGGKTWTRFGDVKNPEGQGGEPTIAQTKSGKILMMLRTKDGELWHSVSTDKGEAWATPTKTGLTATSSASHLLCMRNGTLVLTVNPARTTHRFPLTMRISRDEGQTWSEAAILANRPREGSGWATCYPTATELADGSLIVVWTRIKSSPGEVYGDIFATRVRIAKP